MHNAWWGRGVFREREFQLQVCLSGVTQNGVILIPQCIVRLLCSLTVSKCLSETIMLVNCV